MMKKLNIIPERGERAFICGQTGSGKTGFAVWLLGYMPGTLIYDTKEEKKFNALPNRVIVKNMDEARKAFNDNQKKYDYVILRPTVAECLDPAFLDSLLIYHYNYMRHIGAYIDEVFMFHNGGRVGAGLMALLTRGRSRGITLTMSAQRPAWLSRFCLTESQRFYVFRLVDRDDRKRLSEIIPGMDVKFNPEKYYFQYYDFGLMAPMYFSPVKLDQKISSGYIDTADDENYWL